jgi:Arc/MetJ-type ribon-helix-helix transcriptional regulator
MATMTLRRTTIFLNEDEHRALFERALDESRETGQRVSMTEIIRRAVKAYLQPMTEAKPRKVVRKPSR